jgi:hypothetical protein
VGEAGFLVGGVFFVVDVALGWCRLEWNRGLIGLVFANAMEAVGVEGSEIETEWELIADG